MAKKYHFLCIIPLTLAISTGAYGGLYKWVDENGNTHFGDAIPPEYVKKQHNEMSKSGIVTTTHEREKTKAEVQQAKKEKALAKRLEKERIAKEKAQNEADRILLDTYLTATDLSRTKDRRIATIEGTIRLTQNNIELLSKTLKQLKKDVIEHADDEQIMQQLKMAKAQLLDYEKFIDKKKKEQNEIRTEFDQDLRRFKALKGQPE